MQESEFNVLYRDDDFHRRLRALARTYFRANIEAFQRIALFEQGDLEQELWLLVSQNERKDAEKLLGDLEYDIKDMLRKGNAQKRWHIEDEAGFSEGASDSA